MKRIIVSLLLLAPKLIAMERPVASALPVTAPQLPVVPVVEQKKTLPGAKPFVKQTNILSEALCQQIQALCPVNAAPPVDSFDALNAVEQRLIKAGATISDTSLFYRLLSFKGFSHHVDILLGKIDFYKNDLRPDSWESFSKMIDALIFSKLSEKMKVFLQEMYVSKYEKILLNAGGGGPYECQGISGGNIYFTSNQSFYIGFDPNHMNEDQKVLLFEQTGSGTWKSSMVASAGKTVISRMDEKKEKDCTGFDLSNHLYKYNNGKTILCTYLPGDEFFKPGFQIGKDVDGNGLPALSFLIDAPSLREYAKSLGLIKLSHGGKKVAFVAMGIKGKVLQIKLYVAIPNPNYDDLEKLAQNNEFPLNTHNYDTIEIADYARSDLPRPQILFSHNDALLCLIVGNTYCGMFDLLSKTPPKKLNAGAVSSATFTHDDSQIVVATTNHELCCYETKNLTEKGRMPFAPDSKQAEKAVYYLKFSPDDSLLVAVRMLTPDDSVITMLSNKAREKRFVELLQEMAAANARAIQPLSSPAKERLRGSLSQLLEARRKESEEKLRKLAAIPSSLEIKTERASSREGVLREGRGPLRCLALDGVGMQLLFSLGVIEKLAEMSPRPLHEIFDCIIGSSSASMIACAVAAAHPNSEGVATPLFNLREISGLFSSPLAAIFAEKQKSEEKNEKLLASLKILFKSSRTKDVLKRLLIPYEEISTKIVGGQKQDEVDSVKVFDSTMLDKIRYDELSDIAFLGALDELWFISHEDEVKDKKGVSQKITKAPNTYRYNSPKVIVDHLFRPDAEQPEVIMIHITPFSQRIEDIPSGRFHKYRCLKPSVYIDSAVSVDGLNVCKGEVDKTMKDYSYANLLKPLFE